LAPLEHNFERSCVFSLQRNMWEPVMTIDKSCKNLR
jgi:hypothetical protein